MDVSIVGARKAPPAPKPSSQLSGSLPTFLVLGAPRAGTTWIERHLRHHPQIFLPSRKELHFFDRDDNYERGIEHYASQFRDARGAKALGEVTPDYLHRPAAAARIRECLGDVKLIVSLRDPVERAYSRYWNAKGKYAKNAELSFEKKLARKPEFILEGYYYDHVRRYLELFGEHNVLCMLFDDLKTDGVGFMRTIYRFIGVDDSFVPRSSHSVINASASKRRNGRSALLYYLRGASARLKLEGLADKLDAANRSAVPPVAAQTRRRLLHEHYLGQIEKLERLIERDLGAWKRGA